MRLAILTAASSLLMALVAAAPAPAPELERRQLLSNVLGEVADLVDGISTQATSPAQVWGELLTALEKPTATATPTSPAQVETALASIYSATPTNLIVNAIEMVQNSLSPSDLNDVLTTYSAGCNSEVNINLRSPSRTIFPKKAAADAPYSLSEAQLRQVIQIPAGFTYGRVPPVVLVPGTGSKGCLTFRANFIKLFQGSQVADPVWLNIPGFLLGDAQVNAEYVAYAINYISAISSNKNVSVIAWSQGNLDTQWALKYWPSTRPIVSDFISISPDFHGTVLAYIVCPGFPTLTCVPSVIQQEYDSDFVTRLRLTDGDSAYVPTTSIYSATDEIVQPQQGTGASAFIKDARGVGVSNNELQTICPGGLAGSVVTHEGVLYNPIAYALAVDALTHSGPGLVSRIDRAGLCQLYAAPGLTVADVVATEGNIPVALAAIALYEPKVVVEPKIKGYATY
ncbi:alpha/beta-hydrolase [Aulographum hederae CBS 113979]|uniref:Alpha/beta-hydrolase n=1 Tax=Aulographum hederae CBS 113979 TaxID=1176131 RepID=A0A6G1H8D3_9PEZI|nr:alpha/beta-hydrolase [Aulographum hederae CBS 113979]